MIETERYLITDEGIDNLHDKTFIYPNGKFNQEINNKIKDLLKKKNFILIFNFDHGNAFGVILKDVHNYIDKNDLPYHKVFVVQSDMNLNKSYQVQEKNIN